MKSNRYALIDAIKNRYFVILAFVLMLSSLTFLCANTPPVVSNMTASQRTDGTFLVDIYYDVYDADGDQLKISLEVSDDGGSTWDVDCQLVSGDVGTAIISGIGKHIVWDMGSEHPDVIDTYKFKVVANDGFITAIDLSQFVTGLPEGQTFSGVANNAGGINGNMGFNVFRSAGSYPTSVLKFITINDDMSHSGAQSAFPQAPRNMGNQRIHSTGDKVYMMGVYWSSGRDPLHFNKYDVQTNTIENVSVHSSWPTGAFSDIEPLDILKSSNGKVYIMNEWRYVNWSDGRADIYMRVSSDDMVSWGPWIRGAHIGGEGMVKDAMMIEGSDNHVHIALWTTWGGADKAVYFKYDKESNTFVQKTVLGSGKNACIFFDNGTNKLCMAYLNNQGQLVYRVAALSNTNTWSSEQIALSLTSGTWGISNSYANSPFDQGRHLYMWTSNTNRHLVEWDGNSNWVDLGSIPSTMPDKHYERARIYLMQDGDLHIVQGYKSPTSNNYYTKIEQYP